jgi:anti-anti-sigma regulatory factor
VCQADHRLALVTGDLAALGFCDGGGLGALVRMAGDAGQAGCVFRLARPRPWLVQIMRVQTKVLLAADVRICAGGWGRCQLVMS